MDTLIADFDRLSTATTTIPGKTVYHDASVILESWGKQLESLDLSRLAVQPGEFASARELYDQLVQVLVQSNCCMMELIPYIDDLLEHYENICTLY